MIGRIFRKKNGISDMFWPDRTQNIIENTNGNNTIAKANNFLPLRYRCIELIATAAKQRTMRIPFIRGRRPNGAKRANV